MKSFHSKLRADAARSAVRPSLHRCALFTLAALATWTQLPAQAQSTDASLPPVTVSSSRFPNDPVFAPVAATVITSEQIRDAGITDANSAIRKLGGVNGRQSLSSPRDFPLDLRGFGANGDQNMVILVDGVRISENELTTPLLSSIPVETIERIEIVRGGSSVLYGSGATAGTIQIITKRPEANKGYGAVVAELGTDGQRAGRLSVARGWQNMAIDANYSKESNDGYRNNGWNKQENFGTTVQWFDTDWRFGLRASLARASFGLPGSLTQAQFNADPRRTNSPLNNGGYDNDTITAFLERRFGAVDVAAELSHREKISRANYVDSGSTLQANSRSNQFSPRVRHVSETGALKNELVGGVDLSDWTIYTAANYGDSNAAQRSKAAYLRDEVEIAKNARIAGGVRREVFNQSSSLSGYSRSSGVNAWDLQASYAVVSMVRTFVKTGQSYRLATSDENAFQLPGQILKPQVSHDLEVGATLGKGDNQLTARLFRHQLRDELYYNPLTFQNTNLDPTRHQGVEIEGRLRATESILLTATYQHVQAKFTEGVYKDKEVALVPKNTLSARVNWKAGNQSADLGARWVDRQYTGNDFLNTCRKMPSFTTVDARYAVRISAWEFAVAGTNLTDRNYYSQAYGCSSNVISGIYPENGRAVKFTARYDF